MENSQGLKAFDGSKMKLIRFPGYYNGICGNTTIQTCMKD